MTLTLEVAPPHAATLGAASRATFGPEGGSIGRAKGSDWVLPHSKVSGRHARISCARGVFYIEDTSTNGVFVNHSRARLARGRPHPLAAGDRLFIDPYEIRVSVSDAADLPGDSALADLLGGHASAPSSGMSDPFGGAHPFESLELDDPFAPRPPRPQAPARAPAVSSTVEPTDELHLGQELDPLKLLDPGPQRPPVRHAPSAKDLEGGSPLAGHYQPPPVRPVPAAPQEPPAIEIPEDYDPLSPDDSGFTPLPVAPASAPPAPQADLPRVTPLPDSPTPVPTARFDAVEALAPRPVVAPAAPTPRTSRESIDDLRESDLAAVLEGAGLEGVEVTSELARDFGRILRIVVSGVMDVLRARQQIKDEFRMRMTQFKPADNNPLKFSANVEDALHNLLVKRNAAYLEPVDAFEDAFDDVRNHQIAMLAGMRVAFESMLAHFDANRLQERFDRQGKRGALVNVPAKLRYWDCYREQSSELANDPEAAFRKLFGEVFAKAYEEQLSRLRDERRARRDGSAGP